MEGNSRKDFNMGPYKKLLSTNICNKISLFCTSINKTNCALGFIDKKYIVRTLTFTISTYLNSKSKFTINTNE